MKDCTFKRKVVVDTNVPLTANLALQPDCLDPDLECILKCVQELEEIRHQGGLVLDDGDEIFSEYRKKLSLSGQPGLGDLFLKWVHDHRWGFPVEDRVSLTKNGTSYDQFPSDDGLEDFDISDRKFVAVANAHPGNPIILQATDSKWWGWRRALERAGIEVAFLCPKFIQKKHAMKMGG